LYFVVEFQNIPSTERDLNPGPRKCIVHIPFTCSLECFNDDGQPENVRTLAHHQAGYRTANTPDLCSVGKEVEADPGGLFQGNILGFKEAEGPNQTS
jgi:hypothetical protein